MPRVGRISTAMCSAFIARSMGGGWRQRARSTFPDNSCSNLTPSHPASGGFRGRSHLSWLNDVAHYVWLLRNKEICDRCNQKLRQKHLSRIRTGFSTKIRLQQNLTNFFVTDKLTPPDLTLRPKASHIQHCHLRRTLTSKTEAVSFWCEKCPQTKQHSAFIWNKTSEDRLTAAVIPPIQKP